MIFRKLKVLSDDEIIRIVEGAFRVLRTTGCLFDDDECMDELASAGCNVDRGSRVVKFTEDAIFDALDNVPSVTPPDDMPKARSACANKGFVLDYGTRRMRRGTTDDARKAIALCNALDNITLASCGVVQEDVPEDAIEVFNTAMLLKYSQKLFNQWVYLPENVPHIIEMAKIVTGGEEELRQSRSMSYMLNPITPLQYPRTQLKMARMYAAMDLPLAVASMTQAGSTAPATLAGALVVCAAEMLAGLVWVRSLRTNSPVGLGALTQVIDMKTARQLYAGPEQTLMFLGAHQIIRYLGYTSGNTCFETDSCDFDKQNGWEKALSGVLCWAAGIDMFGQAGFLADGFSMEQLVLDDEALGQLNRVAQGVVVDDDSLAFEAVRNVGPGGNFLGDRHTARHARDFWLPKVFRRESYEQWQKGGGRHAIDMAHDRVEKLLADSALELQVSEDQAAAIDEIVARRLAETGAREGVN